MFDAVNTGAIPSDAPAVAGYVNGRFVTWLRIQKQFPKAKHLPISVFASGDAECLDVETGDASPAEVPAWVKRQQARGIPKPVIYCSLSLVRAVLAELATAGIPRTSIRLWTAHYTHVPHRCSPKCGLGMSTTADATQFTDRALGRSLDESLLADNFFDAAVSPAERRRRKILAAKKAKWRAHRLLAIAALHTVGRLSPSIAKSLRGYIAQLDALLKQK